ncbi:MAG: hypothetical protein HQM12_05495 [SAR324 cluster bacterium]|nr:hypothetical protein [SAR324 cluster bacterium]
MNSILYAIPVVIITLTAIFLVSNKLNPDTTNLLQRWFSQPRFQRAVNGLIWSPLIGFVLTWMIAPEWFRTDMDTHFLKYSLPALLTVTLCYMISTFCWTMGGMRLENMLFGGVCWLWGNLGVEMLFTENLVVPEIAVLVCRMDHTFLVNVTGLILHTGYKLLDRPHRKLIIAAYVWGFLLMFLTPGVQYYQDVPYHYYFGLYPRANSGFWLFGIIGTSVFVWLLWLLYRGHPSSLDKRDRFYLAVGLAISGLFNIGSIPPLVGLEVYPLGNFTFLPMLLCAYGIYRHDILKLNPYSRKRLADKAVRVTITTGYLLLIPVTVWALRGLTPEYVFQRLVPYGIPPLITFLTCLFLSMMLFRMSNKQPEAWVFNFYCLLYAFLNGDILLNGIVTSAETGLRLNRMDHFFLVFLIGLYVHLMFLATKETRYRWLITVAYGLSAVLVPLTQTPWYFKGMYQYYWGFFAQKDFLFDVISLLLTGTLIVGTWRFFRAYQRSTRLFDRHRLKFLGAGYLLTTILLFGNIPAIYGYEFYPTGNFTFIPLLIFAYGLLIHNRVELLQTLRFLLYWCGMAGFVVLVTLGFWKVEYFGATFAGHLSGGLLLLGSVSVFSRFWNAVLNLFLIAQTEVLREVFNVTMELLSQATRYRELYQFISYSLFQHLSSSRCTLLIQQGPELLFEGWSYLSFQRSFWGEADPVRDSERPVTIEATDPIFRLCRLKRNGFSLEQAEEWSFNQKHALHEEFSGTEWLQPLFQDDQLKGVILLGEKTSNALYSHAEQDFLLQLSLTLGPYLKNLELVQDMELKVKDRTREVERLNQLAHAVNSSLDMNVVIDAAMAALKQVFEFDQLFIFIANSRKQLATQRHMSRGLRSEQLHNAMNIGLNIETSYSVYVSTYLSNEFSYYPHITEELKQLFVPEDKAYIELDPVQGVLLYPLSVHNQPFGVLHFGSYQPFTMEEPTLYQIQQYVDQIATAIYNSNLYEQSQRDQIELARQHEALKQAQTQLVQAEKMSAIGVMVAGVAHEINTPAAAIQAAIHEIDRDYVQLMAGMTTILHDMPEETRELYLSACQIALGFSGEWNTEQQRQRAKGLQQILEQAGVAQARKISKDLVLSGFDAENLPLYLPLFQGQAGADIVRSLWQVANSRVHVNNIKVGIDRIVTLVRAFKHHARVDSVQLVETSLQSDLEETLVLLHNKLKRGVTVHRELADLPPYRCYADQLNQVWMNLINNAIQAMGGKGELWVRTRRVNDPMGSCWNVVEIEDNGPGIPPEVLPRIFEAFFTTKAKGEGTGLGLSIVKDIVEKNHQGMIEVESVPGKTCFRVLLPLDLQKSQG